MPGDRTLHIRSTDRSRALTFEQRCESWGIAAGFEGGGGEWNETPRRSRELVLEILSKGEERPPDPSVRFIKGGERLGPHQRGTLILESGEEADPAAPLPLGYHLFLREGEEPGTLVVTPPECYLPEDLRAWGWAIQLYAVRSRFSWGIGDLGDLRSIAHWTAQHGGGMSMINPLHAVAPVTPQEASPYSPGSRCFRNPLYLRVEDVSGAGSSEDVTKAAEAGRRLNDDRRIDRDAVYDLKLGALASLWEGFLGDQRFEDYVTERGESLWRFATFMTIAETHGSAWREWPEDLRSPDSSAVARFRAGHNDRIRFHAWLQWLLEEQLARAAGELDLVHDLAIGVSPDGADAWIWQDGFATGATVGAPPDAYNTSGQNWGALAFDPWALRAQGYEPFIETIRAAMSGGGGMRFDHVMGLFRLYWIPDGADPLSGAYVRYPYEELLGILALESVRNRSYVIGEDLGTVEPVVREEMARRKMLSYKLLWFEDEHPRSYPALSLAAATSHDLPTTAGLWTGEDAKAQADKGVDPALDFVEEMVQRLQRLLGIDRDASVSELIDKSYRALSEASSALVMGSLEDIIEVVERYNSPGTTGEWNWSTALPVALEDILGSDRASGLAAALSRSAPEEGGGPA